MEDVVASGVASKRSREDANLNQAAFNKISSDSLQDSTMLAERKPAANDVEPVSKRVKSDGMASVPREEKLSAEGSRENVARPDGNLQPEEVVQARNPSRIKDPTKARGKGKKKHPGEGTRPRGGGKSRRSDNSWGPRTKPQSAEADGADEDMEFGNKGLRFPKKKVALLMSYCGTGCSGMQFQDNGVRTIEGLLWDALIKAGAVSQDNADHPSKVNLQRSARTDAGVHAAGNLISLKMITAPPIVPHGQQDPQDGSTSPSSEKEDPAPSVLHTPQSIIAHINSFLPAQIRLWSFVRTKNSFHARTECDSRMYEYLFPSWLLLPPRPGSSLGDVLSSTRTLSQPLPNYSFWDGVEPLDKAIQSTPEGKIVFAADLTRKRAWRVPIETLDNLRSIIKQYEGTHCFHNYTLGRDFSDRTTHRFMMRLEARDPQVFDGTEWISVRFHGQSFMLHQRKMISLAILCCRSGTPAQLIPETFGPKRISIPKAPSLGLLLEQPIFGAYNAHLQKMNEKLEEQPSLSAEDKEAQRRDPIDFGAVQDQIDKFKVQFIYERMREEEAKLNVFDRWIAYIDSYGGSDFQYLNPKGTISADAVIARERVRPDAFKEWGNERILEGDVMDVEDEEVKGMKGKDLEETEG